MGGSLSWGAFGSFIDGLDTSSAVARDTAEDGVAEWTDTLKTNVILADIYDLLAAINANMIRMVTGKKQKITPYPRPGKQNGKEVKHFGADALPPDELEAWFSERIS